MSRRNGGNPGNPGGVGDAALYEDPSAEQTKLYDAAKAARAGLGAAAGDAYADPQDAIKQFLKEGVMFTFTRLPDQDVSLQVDGVPGSGVVSGTYYLESGNPTFEAISIDDFSIAANGVPTFNSLALENLQVDNLYAYHGDAIQLLRQDVQDRKKAADEISANMDGGYEVPAALSVKAGLVREADNEVRIGKIEQMFVARKAFEERKAAKETADRQTSLEGYLSEEDPIKKKSLLTQYVMGCVGSNDISFYGDQVNINAGKKVILETAMDDFKVTEGAIPKEFMTDIMEAMSAFGVTNRFDADAIRKINTASEQLIRISQESVIGGRAVTAVAKELQKQVFNLYGLDNTKQGQSPDLVAKANIHFATSVELALGEENAPKVIANANQRAVLTPDQLDSQQAAIRNAKTSDAVRRAGASDLVSATYSRERRAASHVAGADATVTQKGVFEQIAGVVGAKEAKDALNQGGSVSMGDLTITKKSQGTYNISSVEGVDNPVNFTVARSLGEGGYTDFSLSGQSVNLDRNLQKISESLQEKPSIAFEDQGIGPSIESNASAEDLLNEPPRAASPSKVRLDTTPLRARGGAPSTTVSGPAEARLVMAERGISGKVSSSFRDRVTTGDLAGGRDGQGL